MRWFLVGLVAFCTPVWAEVSMFGITLGARIPEMPQCKYSGDTLTNTGLCLYEKTRYQGGTVRHTIRMPNKPSYLSGTDGQIDVDVMQESGALVSLMIHHAYTEQPLPLDRQQVYQMFRAARPKRMAVIDKVLEKCFVEKADGWHHPEVDRQIALCNRSRRNGKKGGRPGKKRNPERTQTITQTEPRRNLDETQTEPKPGGSA